ncbi:FxSxx-COOH system tetratricopeptide repeat protein [Actinomadura nitritigenes]|uniref:FxSxx-COOH system tetratricopeptide repeat protein n=1 Tax=Actinomadura nitritigenes TaxID=134602 RepID=UPI0036A57BA4
MSTGPDATNIQHQTVLPAQALRPVEQVTAPPGTVNVPWHEGVFVGRQRALVDLDAALKSDAPVVIAAVHGLGGVGKSTLAARYAATHTEVWHPVWWVTADSAAALQAGLANLAVALQPELAQALPLEALAGRAVAWLAAHREWLLILDNVTDPADLTQLLGRRLPGRIVITSRLSQGWHRYAAKLLHLDVLSERQAIELLLQIANHLDSDTEDLARLCQVLGHLPLAIEQVAGYLRQTGLAPADYLELLREKPAVMYDRAARGSDAERTIARIWRITLSTLADEPLAGHLLRVMAWWGSEAIPRTLLTLNSSPEEVAEVTTALGSLAAYNMITLDAKTITVHRLVQAVLRTPDHFDSPSQNDVDHATQMAEINAARQVALEQLKKALPGEYISPDTWTAWRGLIPHIEAFFAAALPHDDSRDACDVLLITAAFLNSQGRADQAEAFLARSLNGYERLLGKDHRSTLECRNELYRSHMATKGPAKTIKMLEMLHGDARRSMGEEDILTVSCHNNVAYAYLKLDKYDQALPILEAGFGALSRLAGEDNVETLVCGHNLARAYHGTKQNERALQLLKKLALRSECAFGREHVVTLSLRGSIAKEYQEIPDFVKAIRLGISVLRDLERALGEDHPETLAACNNLGSSYMMVGNLKRATPLLQRALHGRERILGNRNEDTIISRSNLAILFSFLGDEKQARQLLHQCLIDGEPLLGGSHPLMQSVRLIIDEK